MTSTSRPTPAHRADSSRPASISPSGHQGGKHRAPSAGSKLTTRNVTLFASLTLASSALLSPAIAAAAPAPVLNSEGNIVAPARTQISLDNTTTGTHWGTANEHESRPGLSLVKLYIADYVVKHGDQADIPEAMQMIRFSDDNLASKLYAKYPDSINATARDYHLADTHGASHWGYSTTSSADTNSFILQKRATDPQSPVLVAMSQMSPVAADGYQQDYGTATIAGVTGSKLGWSDDRKSVHASVSFGPDFVISANTYGDKDTLTSDVHNAIAPSPVPEGPAGSLSFVTFASAQDLARGALEQLVAMGVPVDPALASQIPSGLQVPTFN